MPGVSEAIPRTALRHGEHDSCERRDIGESHGDERQGMDEPHCGDRPGQGNGMLMVSASGTAVVVEPGAD
jgi:hypothetical protein